jgi:putative alpha-1,2-mannosidase
MVGSPGTILYADGALKGLDGWDQESGYQASVAQATGPTPPESRGGIEDWTTLGYVSSANGPGASLTLEYAWADRALALWGDALGHDSSRQWETSEQWRNTWDPSVGFFQSRNPDGSFTEFEDELYWADDYVEGNAWHYVWTVPYDVDGMIEVQHGGDRVAFYARYAAYWQKVYEEPDDNLPDDWYWHGNEPVLHYAWLGSLAGRRDLTAEAERWVALHRYSADELGLDGNDDAGTLSAWYLWAALGVYPISGTDRYAVGTPLVEHAEVETERGTLVVDAPALSEANLYPVRVEVDGDEVGGEITHDRLAGGHLVFTLSD